VHGEVEDHARTRLAAQPPAAQPFGEQVCVCDAHPQHAAERAIGDEPAQRADDRGVAQVVVGRYHDARARRRVHHRPGLVERWGQGLLAQHVAARADRGVHTGGVPLVGGGDVDRFHARPQRLLDRRRAVPTPLRMA
jgi:hypothetical protein